MGVSLLELRKRYVKASKALEEYSLKISSRLSRGNTSKTMLKKFNLMSAWISMLEPKITERITIKGVKPKSIILPPPVLNVTEEGKEEITIGIEDYKGEFIPILAFFYGTFSGDFSGMRSGVIPDEKSKFANEVKDALKNNIDGQGNRKDIAFKKGIRVSVEDSTKNVVVSFPATSDFNGSPITTSSNIVNVSDFAALVVKGGVTEKSPGVALSSDSINTYNSVLEDMAIELKISYKD